VFDSRWTVSALSLSISLVVDQSMSLVLSSPGQIVFRLTINSSVTDNTRCLCIAIHKQRDLPLTTGIFLAVHFQSFADRSAVIHGGPQRVMHENLHSKEMNGGIIRRCATG